MFYKRYRNPTNSRIQGPLRKCRRPVSKVHVESRLKKIQEKNIQRNHESERKESGCGRCKY